MSEEISVTSPKVCPVCETEQEFPDCLSHSERDNGNYEFLWECGDCENRFTTINQSDIEGVQKYTFMWLEEEDERMLCIVCIEGGEESFGVKAKRADLNMRKGNNYEVQGREWAVERLFELFNQHYDLPEADEGPLEIPWLPDDDE